MFNESPYLASIGSFSSQGNVIPLTQEATVRTSVWSIIQNIRLCMQNKSLKTLSCVLVTFIYLLVGAAIFDTLETPYEATKRMHYQSWRNEVMRNFSLNETAMEELFDYVFYAKPFRYGKQWGFAGSIYFATTVVTVIGYGFSTPRTTKGKVFCMLYALPGIPLCMIMFQSIGERMNSVLTCLLRSVKRLLGLPNPEEVSQGVLIFISGNLCSVVFIVGAIMFKHIEGWSSLESMYYCIITLTTVGFGDYVPLQMTGTLQTRPDYVAFTLLFILFGLTVISSAMNLFILRFIHQEQSNKTVLKPSSNREEVLVTSVVNSERCDSIISRMMVLNQRQKSCTHRLPEEERTRHFSNTSSNVDFFQNATVYGRATANQIRPQKFHQTPSLTRNSSLSSSYFSPWCCCLSLSSYNPPRRRRHCCQHRHWCFCYDRHRHYTTPRHYTVVRAPANCVHHLIHPCLTTQTTNTSATSVHRGSRLLRSIPTLATSTSDVNSHLEGSTTHLEMEKTQQTSTTSACPHSQKRYFLNVSSIYAQQTRSRRNSL